MHRLHRGVLGRQIGFQDITTIQFLHLGQICLVDLHGDRAILAGCFEEVTNLQLAFLFPHFANGGELVGPRVLGQITVLLLGKRLDNLDTTIPGSCQLRGPDRVAPQDIAHSVLFHLTQVAIKQAQLQCAAV